MTSSMIRPRLECRDAIHEALVREMSNGRDGPTIAWIARERQAVADAATTWAAAHGIDRVVTASDVESVEPLAVGHFDYASKLALYVAELVFQQDTSSDTGGRS